MFLGGGRVRQVRVSVVTYFLVLAFFNSVSLDDISVETILLDSSHTAIMICLGFLIIAFSLQSPHFPLLSRPWQGAESYAIMFTSMFVVSSNQKSMWCFFLGYVFMCPKIRRNLFLPTTSFYYLSLYSTMRAYNLRFFVPLLYARFIFLGDEVNEFSILSCDYPPGFFS